MEHILTTERLVLRPIEDKDKDDMAAHWVCWRWAG